MNMCAPLTENRKKKRCKRKDEGVREGATDEGSHDVWASCCTGAEVWRKESVREGGDRWAGREGGRRRKGGGR